MSQIPSPATRQARRARVRYDRCPTCQRVDVDGLHVDRCAEKETYRQHALAAGRAAGVPDVTTSDLWAHLNSRTYNELTSTHVLQLILDLGWRPVVGNDQQRLWPDGAEGSPA
jgi:Zn-finger nucleic acid-binding protein